MISPRLPKWVYRDVDRHGVERFYFRRERGKGTRKVLIGTDPELPAFWAAYAAAVAAKPPEPIPDAERPGRPLPGTLRALVADYCVSPDFRSLDPETVKAQRNVLESCCREPLEPGSKLTIGGTPLSVFGPEHVQVLRDRKADAKNTGNQRIKALKRMFKWAKATKYKVEGRPLTTNPTAEVDRFKIVTDGHHTWNIDEVQQFEARHAVGSKARLALALLLFTGQRISDIRVLGRQHERRGVLTFTQHKGRNRSPVQMELPILPQLREVLDASPTGDLTYLVSDWDQPFQSTKSLGQKMRDWCDAAGLKHCSAHGLRKAGACIAAENGATEAELMAIFGWRDTRQAALYIRKAQRRKLAHNSMHKLIDMEVTKEQEVDEMAQPKTVGAVQLGQKRVKS